MDLLLKALIDLRCAGRANARHLLPAGDPCLISDHCIAPKSEAHAHRRALRRMLHCEPHEVPLAC